MAKFNKKKSGDLPAISTASLPDIVFMLLFFFMVATVMRDSTLMVQNKFGTVEEVGAFVLAERAAKREELQNVLTTALKVDSDTKMGIISDIKQELRKVNALKLNYTTRVGDYTQNFN